MLTLIKNYSDEKKTQKRVNVKKIISLKNLINKPLKNVTLIFDNINDIYKLKNLDKINDETDIKIILNKDKKKITFQLKDKRYIDNKLLNSLNLSENLLKD